MPEVEERHSSIIHVYQSDRTSNELKVEMERTIFSIQYSDGTAILKKYRPSKVMTVVVASVSVVIFILILVLIVLGILYWRMRRRLARIAVMTTELQFDTESPAIKVMKFLQVWTTPVGLY